MALRETLVLFNMVIMAAVEVSHANNRKSQIDCTMSYHIKTDIFLVMLHISVIMRYIY